MGPPEPVPFRCEACGDCFPLAYRCQETASVMVVFCVLCCGCESHHGEVEGRVVLDFTQAHPWRGLQDSEHRMRRWR